MDIQSFLSKIMLRIWSSFNRRGNIRGKVFELDKSKRTTYGIVLITERFLSIG